MQAEKANKMEAHRIYRYNFFWKKFQWTDDGLSNETAHFQLDELNLKV